MKQFLKVLAAAFGFAAMSLPATAQSVILTVDGERVEAEAAAYKDFNLQTTKIRENIVQLRQYIARGGLAEQEMAKLEEEKAVIGADEYEKRKTEVEQRYAVAQRNLQILEYQFDQLRREATVQVERARQPVLRALLKERKAQIILPKRIALSTAAGIDVTTEYIERLDEQLPSVTLSLNNAPAEKPAEKKDEGNIID